MTSEGRADKTPSQERGRHALSASVGPVCQTRLGQSGLAQSIAFKGFRSLLVSFETLGSNNAGVGPQSLTLVRIFHLNASLAGCGRVEMKRKICATLEYSDLRGPFSSRLPDASLKDASVGVEGGQRRTKETTRLAGHLQN